MPRHTHKARAGFSPAEHFSADRAERVGAAHRWPLTVLHVTRNVRAFTRLFMVLPVGNQAVNPRHRKHIEKQMGLALGAQMVRIFKNSVGWFIGFRK